MFSMDYSPEAPWDRDCNDNDDLDALRWQREVEYGVLAPMTKVHAFDHVNNMVRDDTVWTAKCGKTVRPADVHIHGEGRWGDVRSDKCAACERALGERNTSRRERVAREG